MRRGRITSGQYQRSETEVSTGKFAGGQVKVSEFCFDYSHWSSVLGSQNWFTLLKYPVCGKNREGLRKDTIAGGNPGAWEGVSLSRGGKMLQKTALQIYSEHRTVIVGQWKETWKLRVTFRIWGLAIGWTDTPRTQIEAIVRGMIWSGGN